VNQSLLPFLKLKNDTMMDFIKADRIIDAYTLYTYIKLYYMFIRMNVPESIKNSTEINNGEVQIPVEQFIITNFINSNDGKDRLHANRICGILNETGYQYSVVGAGLLSTIN
jgi:hypothetical protein